MTPDQMSEIQRSLGRIEGQLEGMETQLGEIRTLDARVDSLEGWRKWLLGIQAAVGAMIFFALKLFDR